MKVCKNGKCKNVSFCMHEKVAISIVVLVTVVSAASYMGLI